ncbi:hypothetical protein KC352_g46361, partial [Hortaea werneckii]
MWPTASRPLRLTPPHGKESRTSLTSFWRSSIHRAGSRVFCLSARQLQQGQTPSSASSPAESEAVKSVPYSQLSIGVPTEVRSGERRVAVTPQNAALLLKKGFKEVLVEHGAGFQAQFPAHDYEAAGATLVNASRVWTDSDIVLKVRPPRLRS